MTKIFYRNIAVFILVAFMIAGMFAGCSSGEEKPAAVTTVIPTKAVTTVAKAVDTTARTATAAVSAGTTATIAEGTKIITEEIATEAAAATEGHYLDEIDFTIDEIVAKEEIIDLGGKTLVMSGWPNTLPLKDDPKIERLVLYERMRVAEQKYNFKIDYRIAVSNGEYLNEMVNHLMAGLYYADIMYTNTSISFPRHVDAGILSPWNDYIDFENPVIKANPLMYAGTRWAGKNYGTSAGVFEASHPLMMYNKDILDREGQPDVLDLIENNQWNWESMLEIAKSCTKDSDGNGIIDQWGLGSAGDRFNFILGVLVSNGASIVDDSGDGMKYSLNTVAAQRALQFVQDLAHVHKVFNYTIMWAGANNTEYKAGRYAMVWAYDTVWRNRSFKAAGIKSMLAPAPMGPDVNKYQSSNYAEMYVIPATAPLPRETAIIYTEICLLWDENLKPIPQYQEAFDKAPKPWELGNASNYTTEREYRLVGEDLFPNFKLNYTPGYSAVVSYVNNNLSTPLMEGKISVAQGVAMMQDAVEAIIYNR